MGTFHITKRKNGEFQFNLKANNGEVILTSEGYVRRPSCLSGVESVRKNAQVAARFEKKVSTNKKFYFNLKATNGQIVGTSEMYNNEKSRDAGILSVTSQSKAAKVKDETL